MAEKLPARLTVTLDREVDGRWIAEVAALPGVLAYGTTEREAVLNAAALALRVLADRIEHQEDVPLDPGALFEVLRAA